MSLFKRSISLICITLVLFTILPINHVNAIDNLEKDELVINSLLESINIDKTNVTLKAGYTEMLKVTAKFKDGSSQDISNYADYVVENADVAEINKSGNYTCIRALSAGNTKIIVSYAGKSSSFLVTVPTPDFTIRDWAIDRDAGYIYAVSNVTGNLLIIRINDLNVVEKIPIGNNPSSISLYSGKLYVAFNTEMQIKIFDIAKKSVVKTIYTKSFPSNVCIDGDKIFYKDNINVGTVNVYDTKTGQEQMIVSERYNVSIAVDDVNHLLYVGECDLSNGIIKSYSTVDYTEISKSNDYGYLNVSKTICDNGYVYYAGKKLNGKNLKIVEGTYNDKIVSVYGNYVYSQTHIYEKDKFLMVGTIPSNNLIYQEGENSLIAPENESNIITYDINNLKITKKQLNLYLPSEYMDMTRENYPQTEAELYSNVDKWVLDQKNNFIYAISKEYNKLIYIRTSDMVTLGERYIGSMPSDICLKDDKIYIALNGSTKIAVLGTSLDSSIDYISLETYPNNIAVGKDKVYYTTYDKISDSSKVYEYNLVSKKTMPVSYGKSLVIDNINNLLYSYDNNKLSVINTYYSSIVYESNFDGSPVVIDESDVYISSKRYSKEDLNTPITIYPDKVIYAKGNLVFSTNAIYDRDTGKLVSTVPFSLNSCSIDNNGSYYLYKDDFFHKTSQITPKVKNILIKGDSDHIIPYKGSVYFTYTTEAYDQYRKLINTEIIWSVLDDKQKPTTEISIDSTGKLEVTSQTPYGTYYIKATSSNNSDMYSLFYIYLNKRNPSYLTINGPKEITLSLNESFSTKYLAEVLDQYKEIMDSEVVYWEIYDEQRKPVNGLKIDINGMLEINSNTEPGFYLIKASTSKNVSSEVLIHIIHRVPKNSNLYGEENVTIPLKGEKPLTFQYETAFTDQLGDPIKLDGVTYAVYDKSMNVARGITIDSNGLLAVSSDAIEGSYYIFVNPDNYPEISKLYSINVVKRIPTTLRFFGATKMVIPSTGHNTSQYSFKIFDQTNREFENNTVTSSVYNSNAEIADFHLDEKGVLEIDKTAKPGTYVILISPQVCQDAIFYIYFTLEEAEQPISSINIYGPSTISLSSQENKFQYNANVFDKYNNILLDQDIEWSVDALDKDGITIDQNGNLSVDKDKSNEGEIIVKAKSKINTDVNIALKVTLNDMGSAINISNIKFNRTLNQIEDLTINVYSKSDIVKQISDNSGYILKGEDYTISKSYIIIKKEYLDKLKLGSNSLIIKFNSGKEAVLNIKIIENSTTNSKSITHIKNASSSSDASISIDYNGNTLDGISNQSYKLIKDKDYYLSNNKLIIKKQYLDSLPLGKNNLIIKFSEGSDTLLELNIATESLSTPAPSTNSIVGNQSIITAVSQTPIPSNDQTPIPVSEEKSSDVKPIEKKPLEKVIEKTIIDEPKIKTPSIADFKDITFHWSLKYMVELLEKGVISGYEDKTLKPDADITRAEAVVMVCNAMGIKPSSQSDYNFSDKKDIPKWADGYIKLAIVKGFITGYSDNTFRPMKKISRAELITIALKAFQIDGDNNIKSQYRDYNSIQSWARKYVNLANEKNIIRGYEDCTFRPNKNITRAETSVVIVKCLKLM